MLADLIEKYLIPVIPGEFTGQSRLTTIHNPVLALIANLGTADRQFRQRVARKVIANFDTTRSILLRPSGTLLTSRSQSERQSSEGVDWQGCCRDWRTPNRAVPEFATNVVSGSAIRTTVRVLTWRGGGWAGSAPAEVEDLAVWVPGAAVIAAIRRHEDTTAIDSAAPDLVLSARDLFSLFGFDDGDLLQGWLANAAAAGCDVHR
ncbi:hypothetical protein [Nocardia sp. NPDC002869]|uniref:hypothetical protein n=1 Tax=Nocardia sp. NPDC002869 TaxID=3161032 RepID=UPI00398CDF2A